jgi:hypothetical protein
MDAPVLGDMTGIATSAVSITPDAPIAINNASSHPRTRRRFCFEIPIGSASIQSAIKLSHQMMTRSYSTTGIIAGGD